MTTEIATTEQLDQQGGALAQEITALAVVDDATFGRAADMLKAIKGYLKRVADVFDPIDKAQIEARKVTIAQRKSLEHHALTAETTLKDRMAAYEREQERQRRAAEAAARREQERLEAEERARVQAEQRRLEEEAETRRLEQAVAAEQAGDTQTAERLIAAPIEVPVVVPRAVFAPPAPVVAAPKADGVSFRDQWDFEIENAAAIPREYLMPDERKIGAYVRAMKESAKIPGVTVVRRRIAAVRA